MSIPAQAQAEETGNTLFPVDSNTFKMPSGPSRLSRLINVTPKRTAMPHEAAAEGE
ncbi:unnamed protein product [marine sediment metagenome]|uniref:Uncharacterized protein n=1 Tax=marine sediment metagenome TaxID=412755 RepID=X0TMN1_9ZZZZ